MFLELKDLPRPGYDDADAELPEEELLALPVPAGREVGLRFASPYEAFLTLDGKRVLTHETQAERRLHLWLGRRLPALYSALESRYGLWAVLQEREVVVLDMADLDEGTFLDHARVRRALGQARVSLPSLAVLGSVTTKGELLARLRGVYAAGAAVEVRAEDVGRVTSRRRVVVGAHR